MPAVIVAGSLDEALPEHDTRLEALWIHQLAEPGQLDKDVQGRTYCESE